ncbi:helix-turn-helix transcriptional regulator [Sinorhizobium sp. BJ1]|uniref:helix-turn-helix domain-containing protein n=1 Tax=Sinorhizobium sp. BJ1 TaxID=2035455 RepID=UPI001FDFAA7E|nr:helix-turn-helix transcriptional regulator [Sinorhizobium sp. BJ1]
MKLLTSELSCIKRVPQRRSYSIAVPNSHSMKDTSLGDNVLGINPKKKRGKADAVAIHVGHRIRHRRVWQNMSQAALGEAIGVTFQQGSNRVGAGRLEQISKPLEVRPSIFLRTYLTTLSRLRRTRPESGLYPARSD